ncbi:unnamed protein product [Blepharisma stoltei]|uniref:Uncharacterized protein n=1 Tax=Blepharisma stoltei TaxID=1481888 RepID=A0AAU9JJJ2_9CILI|nr:unnamed protein product [Blepharisma stoltei]
MITIHAIIHFRHYGIYEMALFSPLIFSEKDFKINFPVEIDKNICMCPLPDNKVFCYGNNWIESYSNSSKIIPGVTFINLDLQWGILSFGSGGAFYDGIVYVFGEFPAKMWN